MTVEDAKLFPVLDVPGSHVLYGVGRRVNIIGNVGRLGVVEQGTLIDRVYLA